MRKSYATTLTFPSTLLCLSLALSLAAGPARADSVAQIATGVRISRSTAALLDPQGRPGDPEAGTDTAARPGDILTFVTHFTPVPNGGARGLGGYVTVYIPRNTEVVGARIIDRDGNTIAPRRGGFASDGIGPRGAVNSYAGFGLEQGSLSQLYADTGVFYSLSPLSERIPDGSQPGEAFLTLGNGILMDPEPTAAGKLSQILNSGNAQPTYAHNTWDYIQALAFGVGGMGAINDRGQGNAPDGFGSAVAGPHTWYSNDAVLVDPMMPLDIDNVMPGVVAGPWERIRMLGAEIGRRGNLPPMPIPGDATRIGILAEGADQGLLLDPNSPLPAFDAGDPGAPYVRAIRFAVGELLVGAEYLCEFSLRVLDTPLDPVAGADIVCAEVFGGDASAEELDGSKDGKDNTWRYFLPAPACVSLNLLFDIDVDKLAALPGETLSYDITAKNLSVDAHTNVEIRHCYDGGALSFVSATGGGVEQAASGECAANYDREVLWVVADWQPGDQRDYTVTFDVDGGVDTIGRAVFTSDQLPAPGFQTVAYTVIDSISIVEIDMFAMPAHLPTAAGQVSYTFTVDNDGTGTPNLDFLSVLLPPGFTYDPGSATVDGTPVGDPTQAMPGDPLLFSAGLVDPARQTTMVLAFTATVDATAAEGSNTCTIEAWFTDPFKGETVNNSKAGVAEVIIGAPRSEVPTVDGPIVEGATALSGTTSEAAGTIIRVFLAGVELPVQGVSDGAGRWTVSGLSSLYAGQRISVTAQAPGELQSLPSVELTVVGVGGGGACDDGVDNDGDGLIDLADPGCSSANDPDEARTPQCADGIDNDGDGKTDFGADEGCSDLTDDTELGAPACDDGVDNDGDGKTDFPDDPGCDSAQDVSEADLPQCADGIDNDGDGKTDFGADDGCESALDGNELPGTTVPDGQPGAMPDAGMGGDGGSGGGSGGSGGGSGGSGSGGNGGDGSRADAGDELGGVDEPSVSDCGCSIPGGQAPGSGRTHSLWLLGMCGIWLRLRLRRRR